MDRVLDTPARAGVPNVLFVGALNNLGKVADFSNFGKQVDVCALGERVSIKIPGGEVQNLEGTFLPVPLVTNAVIKLLQHNNLLFGINLKTELLRELKKIKYRNIFLAVN